MVIIFGELRYTEYDRDFTKLSKEERNFFLLIVTDNKRSEDDISNFTIRSLFTVEHG